MCHSEFEIYVYILEDKKSSKLCLESEAQWWREGGQDASVVMTCMNKLKFANRFLIFLKLITIHILRPYLSWEGRNVVTIELDIPLVLPPSFPSFTSVWNGYNTNLYKEHCLVLWL